MSIASLSAAPRVFLAAGFCGADHGCPIQPGSIDIEDENAILIERDFPWLPGGFVAVVGVLPVEAGFIVIGGNPLFDGLAGWLNGLEGIDFL
jgi:hypothetical protein